MSVIIHEKQSENTEQIIALAYLQAIAERTGVDLPMLSNEINITREGDKNLRMEYEVWSPFDAPDATEKLAKMLEGDESCAY